jgi:hypothetical protein
MKGLNSLHGQVRTFPSAHPVGSEGEGRRFSVYVESCHIYSCLSPRNIEITNAITFTTVDRRVLLLNTFQINWSHITRIGIYGMSFDVHWELHSNRFRLSQYVLMKCSFSLLCGFRIR